MKFGHSSFLLYAFTTCAICSAILNPRMVYASEQLKDEVDNLQKQKSVTLSELENNQMLMKEIVLHVLQDKRSKRRIETKFKEHSFEPYQKWKQAIEEKKVNHLTKKEEFFVFNDAVQPKDISAVITLATTGNHFFRNGKSGPIFVTDKDCEQSIATKFVKSSMDSVSMYDDNLPVLVLLLNIDQISDYILKNGFEDENWRSLPGLIVTMYPTTTELLDSILPRIFN